MAQRHSDTLAPRYRDRAAGSQHISVLKYTSS